MCMEDVRMGRAAFPAVFGQSVTAGSVVQIFPPDPNRLSLVVSGWTANVVYVMFGPTAPAVGMGFALTNGSPVLKLMIDDVGLLLTQAVWVSPVTVDCFVYGSALTLSRQ